MYVAPWVSDWRGERPNPLSQLRHRAAGPLLRPLRRRSPTVSYALATQPSASLQMAINIVQLVQRHYAGIDANRRYITGISMGGFGVWDAIERWPTAFAAAVPVSGAGSPALASCSSSAIWAFHGAEDISVPPSGSSTMMQTIRAAGGTACYTELRACPIRSGNGLWADGEHEQPALPLALRPDEERPAARRASLRRITHS